MCYVAPLYQYLCHELLNWAKLQINRKDTARKIQSLFEIPYIADYSHQRKQYETIINNYHTVKLLDSYVLGFCRWNRENDS